MNMFSDIGRKLLITLMGNTMVAVVLWALSHNELSLLKLWLISQCIGFACTAFALLIHQAGVPARYGLLVLVVACALGMPTGAWLASLAGVDMLGATLTAKLDAIWRYVLFSVAVGFVYHVYYYSRKKVEELEQKKQEAELRELSVQKSALSARLRALQAQIEPHFLFNTLANLHSLIGRDDSAARHLLEQLNDYLRATLAHSRAERATLGDECSMLSAYLGIQAQRMGGRLRWTIDLPPALRNHPLPPMLLQPLVENAVAHGIEPKLGNGQVSLSARTEGARLCLTVADDGVGLDCDSPPGVGLANVRERLAALFDQGARLELKDNAPSGVKAELWIPLVPPAP